MAAGRRYTERLQQTRVVVNETLIKKLRLKILNWQSEKDIRMGSQRWNKIVGVVKDFKTNS